jgi:hypothetical protein
MKLSAKYIGAIVIVAILTLGVAGWFGYGKKDKENPQSVLDNHSVTQSEDQQFQLDEIASMQDLIDAAYQFEPVDTSDWQTYRNEEAGFEVKIPRDWFCGGIALDPDSETSFVCLEKSQKENYYTGKYKKNNLIMIDLLNNDFSRGIGNLPGNSLREKIESLKKDKNMIYSTHLVDQTNAIIVVDGEYYYRHAFDILNNWNIAGFPSVNRGVFDAFLLNFRFL